MKSKELFKAMRKRRPFKIEGYNGTFIIQSIDLDLWLTMYCEESEYFAYDINKNQLFHVEHN